MCNQIWSNVRPEENLFFKFGPQTKNWPPLVYKDIFGTLNRWKNGGFRIASDFQQEVIFKISDLSLQKKFFYVFCNPFSSNSIQVFFSYESTF